MMLSFVLIVFKLRFRVMAVVSQTDSQGKFVLLCRLFLFCFFFCSLIDSYSLFTPALFVSYLS